VIAAHFEPSVYFGRRRRDDDRDSSEPSDEPSDVGLPRLQIAVLIVDDVEDTRFLYQRFFEWHGATVDVAADGASALVQAHRTRPDVIVLDLAMPRMTGWEVLHALKADPRTADIPVVVVSGQDARASATMAGAESYFEKPCLPDVLLREVQRVFTLSRRKLD